MDKLKVAVLGASGFAGEKLTEILLSHPYVEITYISAIIEKDIKFNELFPRFTKRIELTCKNYNQEEAVKLADVFFLATPHKASFNIVPFLLKNNKIVIDLSGDYRFKDVSLYEKYYNAIHPDKENIKIAVYGLAEFYRERIKKARLIANPGCYPTVSILSLAPLVKEDIIENIIIDAKSGITGAGRKASLEYHFAELNSNIFCYKPFSHQHLPEIVSILKDISSKEINLRFTPHVIPVERGILATIYADLKRKVDVEEINSIYQKYYNNEPFIRFYKQRLPQIKDVVNTNFCDIGFNIQDNHIVIVGAIDNLMKGASGNAVCNMNIIFGFPETTGLL